MAKSSWSSVKMSAARMQKTPAAAIQEAIIITPLHSPSSFCLLAILCDAKPGEAHVCAGWLAGFLTPRVSKPASLKKNPALTLRSARCKQSDGLVLWYVNAKAKSTLQAHSSLQQSSVVTLRKSFSVQISCAADQLQHMVQSISTMF